MTPITLAIPTWRSKFWPRLAGMINLQTLPPARVVINTPLVDEQAISLANQITVSEVILQTRQCKDGRDYFNEATQAAIASLPDETWVVYWADDDYYGPTYLESLQAAALAHADAWLLGQAGFTTEWMGTPRTAYWSAPIEPDGRVQWLAGTTIAVKAEVWRRHPLVRYPVGKTNSPDGDFIQAVHAAWLAAGHVAPAPFYHFEADFRLRRYSDPNHQHDWIDPRDRP